MNRLLGTPSNLQEATFFVGSSFSLSAGDAPPTLLLALSKIACPPAQAPSSMAGSLLLTWTSPIHGHTRLLHLCSLTRKALQTTRYPVIFFPTVLRSGRLPLPAYIKKNTPRPTHTKAYLAFHSLHSSYNLTHTYTHCIFVNGLPHPIEQGWKTTTHGPNLSHCLSIY